MELWSFFVKRVISLNLLFSQLYTVNFAGTHLSYTKHAVFTWACNARNDFCFKLNCFAIPVPVTFLVSDCGSPCPFWPWLALVVACESPRLDGYGPSFIRSFPSLTAACVLLLYVLNLDLALPLGFSLVYFSAFSRNPPQLHRQGRCFGILKVEPNMLTIRKEFWFWLGLGHWFSLQEKR